ncbi:MAG TPA: dihydroneopterin aldolase [Miltoncostaeaceae bacterium]|nr:dihydroneopterin aldolase [Miltoncostaeaceae bacterium]
MQADDELTVRIRGLEAFGRHGVHAAEQELGQRFVVDIDIRLSDARSADTDDLALTVDYATLAAAVADIVGGEPVRLLERLASLIADRVLSEPRARYVEVTVRKPHVALPQVVTETAVTLTRHA